MSIQLQIQTKLTEGLAPTHLEVINESYKHNVPKGSESHFKLGVVSEKFGGKRALARHQEIYRLLSEEMEGSVHALSIEAYSPEQWKNLAEPGNHPLRKTPPCLGGEKRNPSVNG